MTRRKGLSTYKIPNLLREISVNEPDEDIKLNESDGEESEESTDIIDNIPVNPDMYVTGKAFYRMTNEKPAKYEIHIRFVSNIKGQDTRLNSSLRL
ncbi:hypothetical protein TNCV_428711 [Trichonephila clavipes]|nr:hypothetical protein TNCV_428711 [Trichonephila clavipes]